MSSDDVTEPTAQQLRDAAATIRQMNKHPLYFEGMSWSPAALEHHAVFKESEQAAEKAKRDRRIEELAGELRQIGRELPRLVTWEDTAAFLLDRYPSLLDEDGER